MHISSDHRRLTVFMIIKHNLIKHYRCFVVVSLLLLFFCGADGTLTCSVLCTEVTSRSRGQRVKAILSFDSEYSHLGSKRREGKLMR